MTMGNALILSQLVLQWLDKLVEMNVLLKTAHEEDRDVSDEELEMLMADDDLARAQLQALIDEANETT